MIKTNNKKYEKNMRKIRKIRKNDKKNDKKKENKTTPQKRNVVHFFFRFFSYTRMFLF